MSDSDYLVALALVQQKGLRIMPINGKSLKDPIPRDGLPNETIKNIALELLLRIINRSEEGEIRKIHGKSCILIIKIPFSSLQNELPNLKQIWINIGNTDVFINDLKKICNGVWSMSFVKYEGIKIQEL